MTGGGGDGNRHRARGGACVPTRPRAHTRGMSDTGATTRRFIREAAQERARISQEVRAYPRDGAPESLREAYARTRRFIERATAPEALAALAAGDAEALEYAVCFIEEHPFCPDSGFALRDIARALKSARIPEPEAARLRAALLAIFGGPTRDEMKHLRQLALVVADEDFVRALDALGESGSDEVGANAAALAGYISKHWGAPPWREGADGDAVR